jgi:site-specific DNA recombinase
VFRQPEIVAGAWKATRTTDDQLTETQARAALQKLDPLWDELFPAEQARIIGMLAERVDVGVNALDARLRVDGLTAVAPEMMAQDVEPAA